MLNFFGILFFLSLFFFTDKVFSQNITDKQLAEPTGGKEIELVLGIPKVTEKNFHLITNSIEKINGLHFKYFCPKHKILLLTFDPAVFLRSEEVVRALKDRGVSMPMFIKEGNFDSVEKMCK